ncbi:MAG: DUF2155 domain-containing protein [Nitrospirae bacterium]|nr:DUF2155 domain-containing protein [Nitrospirota bacterium]
MKIRLIAIAAGIGLLLSLGACKKKEEPVQQAAAPAHETMMPKGESMMPKGETRIVVPDSVKGKWEAVKIEILDKTSNKKEVVTVKLGSEYTIPDSNIKIKVGDFLPDFRMDGLSITSASDELKNPAVHITVYEGDKEIFKSWLYSNFPTIHPFQHEKYSLTLIEAIPAKK